MKSPIYIPIVVRSLSDGTSVFRMERLSTGRRVFYALIGFLKVAALVGGFVAMIMTAYWMGKLAGAFDPARSYEIPMCAAYETDVRMSPTGYVLSHVPAGEMVWFTKMDLPFAHVAYYDGSAWHEGTITATALEVCK